MEGHLLHVVLVVSVQRDHHLVLGEIVLEGLEPVLEEQFGWLTMTPGNTPALF